MPGAPEIEWKINVKLSFQKIQRWIRCSIATVRGQWMSMNVLLHWHNGAFQIEFPSFVCRWFLFHGEQFSFVFRTQLLCKNVYEFAYSKLVREKLSPNTAIHIRCNSFAIWKCVALCVTPHRMAASKIELNSVWIVSSTMCYHFQSTIRFNAIRARNYIQQIRFDSIRYRLFAKTIAGWVSWPASHFLFVFCVDANNTIWIQVEIDTNGRSRAEEMRQTTEHVDAGAGALRRVRCQPLLCTAHCLIGSGEVQRPLNHLTAQSSPLDSIYHTHGSTFP